MKNVSDVQNLTQRLQDKRIKHEVVRLKDYMAHPKDDGYRSVHFVFKYNGSRSSAEGYSGLLVEVQLRTYLQHTWATAVETMGIIRGEAYKSDMGSNEWLDFFALTSSALAIAEELPPLSIHAHLTSEEIIKEVAEKESQLMFLRQIDSIRVAADFLQRKKLNNDGYNLLILRPKEQKIEIMPFGKNNFTNATKAYEDAETRATNGEQIMPVLVAAGSLKSLKTAYPNYFLDIREFVEKVKSIIEVANEWVIINWAMTDIQFKKQLRRAIKKSTISNSPSQNAK